MPARRQIIWNILGLLLFAKMAGADADALSRMAHGDAWLKALHYERTAGGGYLSRIDDQRFFLTEVGRQDPEAELRALVDGLRNGHHHAGEPLSCLMPFRYRLALEHGLVEAVPSPCDKLRFFKGEMGDAGAAIIFVAQYADNPSSIMGHLFLQFINDQKQVEGKPLPYLYKTVNYAAGIPPDTGIFKYIAFGIFGGFTGTYSLYEYADMVEKYNNVESRDIFTYHLNFSADEMERMAEHVWELLQLASHDYYFFDENCAFHILAIFEAVRPRLELISELSFYTTPLNVLKVVARAGMLKHVAYTPSLYQRILDQMQAMTPGERGLFDAVLDGEMPVDGVNSTLVAEALFNALSFRRHERQGIVGPVDMALTQAVLKQRAKLGPMPPVYGETQKTSPHLSHDDARLALGMGHSSHSSHGSHGSREWFGRLAFRPAVHDLLSRHQGFQRNTALSLLAIDLRQYQGRKTPIIEHLQLADLAKLNGTRVEHRLAWRFDFALDTFDRACVFCLSPNFNADFGASQNLMIDRLDAFLLGRLSYRPLVDDVPWHGGLGASGGLSYTPTPGFRLLCLVNRSYNFRGRSLDQAALGMGFDLSDAVDLQFQSRYTRLAGAHTRLESMIDLGYSF